MALGGVDRWSGVGFAARLVVLVMAGVGWTVVSLQSVLLHPDYWDPVTLSDWFSIWAFSLAWLLTGVALLVFGEVARLDTLGRRAIILVSIACAATGLANALEDGFGIGGFGAVYVISVLTALFGLVIVAAMTWGGPIRRLWFVPGIGALAVFSMTLGGGPLALAAWVGLASILVRARSTGPTGP